MGEMRPEGIKMCDTRMRVLEAEKQGKSELTKAICEKTTLDTPREGNVRTKRLGDQN